MNTHEALKARAEALAERVQRAMYEDPFWTERFGARGEQFAKHDGRQHVLYLVDALRYGAPKIVADYATWLQSVLTTRGMCTRHLDDNLARLAQAIVDDGLDEDGRPSAYLEAARRALLYPEGSDARAVQDAAPRLVERAAREARADALNHLSFAADAIALGRDDLFDGYLAFIVPFLAARRPTSAAVPNVLRALARDPEAPPALASLVERTVRA